jgi:hypothetical protein
MQLNLSNALGGFDLAEEAQLDCGTFDLVVRQAAPHNAAFKAAVAKKNLAVKKKSLAVDKGTLTGSEEADVELFVETVIIGWGDRPLKQDDGSEVAYSPEVMKAIFMDTGRPGKILFAKVMTACTNDEYFVVRDEDIKNS